MQENIERKKYPCCTTCILKGSLCYLSEKLPLPQNYVTSEEAVSHNVLHYQQLSVAHYQVSCNTNSIEYQQYTWPLRSLRSQVCVIASAFSCLWCGTWKQSLGPNNGVRPHEVNFPNDAKLSKGPLLNSCGVKRGKTMQMRLPSPWLVSR